VAARPIKILVVAAHPADSFDQAGGTCAHHAADGDQVSALILTGGARSHEWHLQDRQIRGEQSASQAEGDIGTASVDKHAEVSKACALLGIHDLHFLGFEDDVETLQDEMILAIAAKYRELRPDAVITHHPYEEGGFKLHATAGRAALYAVRAAKGSSRVPGEIYEVPVVYFMNPMAYHHISSLGQSVGFFRADLYVDVTDVIDRKIQALECIATQYYGGSFARKVAETSDGRYGAAGHVPYAEQFQRFHPQVTYKLPVSDYDLHRSSETKEEWMTRCGYMTPYQPEPATGTSYEFRRDLYDI